METKILFLGEIVGKGGIYTLKKQLTTLKEEKQIDFVIANGEGATMGFGLGKNHANYIRKLGVDLITLGEKAFFKKDLVEVFPKMSSILRPINFPHESPGRGWKVFEVNNKKVAVISVMGLSGFDRLFLNNPYSYLPTLLEKVKTLSDFIVIDFHASTTAEKRLLLHMFKGQVAIISSTHCKALTADAEILEGTGYISDTGRCGSAQSVGGFEPDPEIKKWTTSLPVRSQESMADLEMQGAIFTINDEGKCIAVETLRIPVENAPADEVESQ